MIRSMTGFASVGGTHGLARWTWDLKTVNAKGLDLRLRLPPGFDASEADLRKRIGGLLTRGTCHASLSVARDAVATYARIDTELLASLVASLAAIERPASIGPATLDGLLTVRGVVEVRDAPVDAEEADTLRAACSGGLDRALAALVAMRDGEGVALATILRERLVAIATLVTEADEAPQRRPEAIMAKLARSIAMLGERHGLDADRLHQEALLLAVKSDVREELDRLVAHVATARDLIEMGGAVGRRLDFLAQELAREASTFCAKANDAALTAIGLELRVEIEQFREQVQNIE